MTEEQKKQGIEKLAKTLFGMSPKMAKIVIAMANREIARLKLLEKNKEKCPECGEKINMKDEVFHCYACGTWKFRGNE